MPLLFPFSILIHLPLNIKNCRQRGARFACILVPNGPGNRVNLASNVNVVERPKRYPEFPTNFQDTALVAERCPIQNGQT